MWRTLLVVFAATLSGCVQHVRDDRIAELRPAKAELHSFAGTYKEKARYHTSGGYEILGEAIGHGEFGSDVVVSFESNGDLLVRAINPKWPEMEPFRAKQGVDFSFEKNWIVFRKKRTTGAESGGIGTMSTLMKWMLDDSGRLVVVSATDGGGVFLVVPVISSIATVATFDRVVKKEPNQAPEPTAPSGRGSS
jgi:hypothetical protein